MNEGKSNISQARSLQEIGEFWDTHDLNDYWEMTTPAAFEVDTASQAIYYPVESHLSDQLRATAIRHGVSAETLVNLWIQEKIAQESAAK